MPEFWGVQGLFGVQGGEQETKEKTGNEQEEKGEQKNLNNI